jgi:hypothetical protein
MDRVRHAACMATNGNKIRCGTPPRRAQCIPSLDSWWRGRAIHRTHKPSTCLRLNPKLCSARLNAIRMTGANNELTPNNAVLVAAASHPVDAAAARRHHIVPMRPLFALAHRCGHRSLSHRRIPPCRCCARQEILLDGEQGRPSLATHWSSTALTLPSPI